MKKKLLTIAMVLTMCLVGSAQDQGGSDGFFTDWTDLDNNTDRTELEDVPVLPYSHGMNDDQEAPLGSGLVILGALGAGYALKKRREE